MTLGPHILAFLEDALSEAFQYHNQLDDFLLRAGLSNNRLAACRLKAEQRKGRWDPAPKRFVAQEVLREIATGSDTDDRLLASLVNALCRGVFEAATPKAVNAIQALKTEIKHESQEAAKKHQDFQRQQEARRRTADATAETKLGQRAAFREQFISLHSLSDSPQARGYALERLLNDFMEFEKLSPRGSFKITGEQIDGSFSWGGHTSLVEAKWTSTLIDGSSFGNFEWKISGKTANTRGLFIAVNGYSAPAIQALNSKGALRFVCIDGAHLIRAIDTGLPELLAVLWRHADETGEAYLPASSPQFLARVGG